MQVAIVSDTHMPRGGRRLPDRCVDLLTGADLIIHAGDISTVAVLRRLETYGEVAAVYGNVDQPQLATLLPRLRTIDVDGVKLGVIHDAGAAEGRLDRMRRFFPDARAVI